VSPPPDAQPSVASPDASGWRRRRIYDCKSERSRAAFARIFASSNRGLLATLVSLARAIADRSSVLPGFARQPAGRRHVTATVEAAAGLKQVRHATGCPGILAAV